MGLRQDIERLSNTAALDAIRIDLLATAHKLRYPLAAILAKIPGDTLAARARAIGVSRQTMYVWAQERFRPSGEQAATIAELTGIPVEQIEEYQEDKDDARPRVREPARKAPARLDKGRKGVSRGKGGAGTGQRGVVAKRSVGGSLRAVRKRTQPRPRGDKSD